MPQLFATVDKELDSCIDGFHRLDRQAFLAHWSLACHIDRENSRENGMAAELLDRYRFHMAAQKLLQDALNAKGQLQAIFNHLAEHTQLSQEDFAHVRATLEGIHATLTGNLKSSQSILAPSMSNVPAGTSLHSLIADRGDTQLPPLSEGDISGDWIGNLSACLEGAFTRLKRVHFKSLGSLLLCHEKLSENAIATQADNAT